MTDPIPDSAPVAALKNLGPASARMLAAAGIASAGELRRLGAMEAYLRVERSGVRVSLNLLYALEGALTGTHWNRIDPGRRTALLLELDGRRAALGAAGDTPVVD